MNNTISVIPLAKTPDYYEEVLHIIEQELNYSSSYSYENDFNLLMNSNNWENCFLIFSDKKLVGHIGVRELNLTLNGFSLPVLFLGGITIRKEFQGRGIFKNAFEEILNKFKNQHALHLLWSGHQDLYKKFHFYEVGQIFQTGNESFLNLQSFLHRKLNTLKREEQEFIQKCYQKTFSKCVKVQRTPQDWEMIFQISSIDVYFQRRDQEYISYFFVNKGQDLQDIIHEVGAVDDQCLEILFEEIEKFKLWVPTLKHHQASSTTLFLAQVRIENMTLLNDWLEKLNQTKLDPRESLETNTNDLFQNKNLQFFIPGVDSI